jgi:hypothetical protein
MTTIVRSSCAALVFAVALSALPAFSEILPNGIDTKKVGDPIVNQPAGGPPCRILWNTNGGPHMEVDRLRSFGFDITATSGPAALALSNLLEYDLVVIAYVGPGWLGSRQPDIEAFVSAGGGLLVHQPNEAGNLDYLPIGFGVQIVDQHWCETSSTAEIVDAGHPVTAPITDDDLSLDADLVGALGPGLTVLARNVDCLDPALAAGNVGSGKVVFETGNADPQSVDPGSDLYWQTLLGWLCTPGGPIATETASWGGVKARYR